MNYENITYSSDNERWFNLEDLSNEEWADINFMHKGKMYDFTGKYQISNYGRVKSFNYHREGITKIMKFDIVSGNYRQIYLCLNGETIRVKAHRLVAYHFIPNKEDKPYVDHIIPVSDGGTDFFLNLRWTTSSENRNNELTKIKISGENSAWYGRKHTEETKRKISENHKRPMLGKKFSNETKRKMSENSPRKSSVVSVNTKTGEVKVYEMIKHTIADGFTRGHVSQACCNKYGSSPNRNIYKGLEWYYLEDYNTKFKQTEIEEC